MSINRLIHITDGGLVRIDEPASYWAYTRMANFRTSWKRCKQAQERMLRATGAIETLRHLQDQI